MKRLATVSLAFALALAMAATATAQGKKESQLRAVAGQVLSKSEDPVPSSVVYLRNLKSQTVITHIADEKGAFRFSGLDPNVDYEIHAEHENMASAKRRVTSFDTRKEIVVNLKLDKGKQ